MSDTSGDARRVAEPPSHLPISSGIVYTFIHEQFEGDSFVPRKGTVADFGNIDRCFTSLGLKVMSPYIDYAANEVINVLREASQSNFSDYGCLVVIIITHYEEYGKLMTKRGCYYENEVIDFFKGDKCKGLVRKPKIFLIQSSKCQELKTDVISKGHTDTDSANTTSVPFTLPTEADILVLRSCYEGGPAHRPEDTGSWTVRQLCKKLEGLGGETSLEDALSSFFNEVKNNRDKKDNPSQVNYKYLPEVTSTLIQPVLFKNSSLQFESEPREFYKQYKKLGKMFIFNYNNVYNKSGRVFLPRDGTDIDADNLESCFGNLGFEVMRQNDLTKEEVFRILLTAKDFDEDTCVAVVVLTHGIEGKLGTYDIPFSEEELYAPFSNKKQPGLVGKPKFFFLQVCRGDKATGSVQVDEKYLHESEISFVRDIDEGQIKTDMSISTNSSEIQFDGPVLNTTLGNRETITIDTKPEERFQTHTNEVKVTLPTDPENIVTLAGISTKPIKCEEINTNGGEESTQVIAPDSVKKGHVETDAAPTLTTDAGKAVPQTEFKTMTEPLDDDDMLVFHSTYAGTPSHRHSKFGSWFIQHLCKVFQSKTQPFSFVHALSAVQKDVAVYEEENIAHLLHKQMPVISSTLTKSLMVGCVSKRN